MGADDERVLADWRAELEGLPVTAPAGTAEAEVALFLHAMREGVRGGLTAGPDPELHGQLEAMMRRERTVAAVAELTRGNLRRVMRAMGYADDETEEAAASVVVYVDGSEVVASFDAPPRAVAFMDAARDGDFERADLVMHAREG